MGNKNHTTGICQETDIRQGKGVALSPNQKKADRNILTLLYLPRTTALPQTTNGPKLLAVRTVPGHLQYGAVFQPSGRRRR